MLSRSTIIIAVILVLVFAVTACAQNGPATPQGRGQNVPPGAFASLTRVLAPPAPRELEKMGMAMNLTDDQKTSIKALYKTFMAALKQTAPDRAKSLKSAIDMMQQASPSKDALLAASTKIQQDDTTLLGAEFDFWAGMKGILTAQQQTAAQAFVQQRMQREMTGPRQGGPKNPASPK
jgi:Spy/CpxP family protein refolding chaperone